MPSGRSTFFLTAFLFIYLLWSAGKFSPWHHPHFDLLLLVFSAFFGLALIPSGTGKIIMPALSASFTLMMLVYALLFPETIVNLPLCYKLLITIPVFSLTFHIAHRNTSSKEMKTFQGILIGYCLLITFSSLMHCFSLQQLDPSYYVTVKKHTVDFAVNMLDLLLNNYLFFPLLLLLTTQVFIADYGLYKRLYWVPLVLIPSFAVAIYQAYGNIEFLNAPFFARLNRVSGLGYDSNSFAISLYLAFPLTILSIILAKDGWKKLIFVLLAVLLIWCLFLSGSRTAFLGIILFLMLLPWVWIWAQKNLSRNRRCFLFSVPFLFAVTLCVLGTVSLKMNYFSSLTLGKRLLSSYHDFKTGGINKILDKSSRSHLWVQAYRLTKESPISGWGPGGFQRNLDNTRFKYGEDPKIQYIDFASNQYLQLTSDLGITGLSMSMLIILLPLWMVFRIHRRIKILNERWAVGISFSAIFIMLFLFISGPWIMVGLDNLFVFIIILSFLIAAAVKHGFNFKYFGKLAILAFIFFVGMFILRTYDHTFGNYGYRKIQDTEWWPLKYEKHCFAVENWDGEKFRWCGKDAFLRIPIKREIPEKIEIQFFINHPDIGTAPVTFEYGGKHGVTNMLVITDISWKTIEIHITDNYIYEFKPPKRSVQKYLVVSLNISRTWIPKEFGINNDTRELGVAVKIPEL